MINIVNMEKSYVTDVNHFKQQLEKKSKEIKNQEDHCYLLTFKKKRLEEKNLSWEREKRAENNRNLKESFNQLDHLKKDYKGINILLKQAIQIKKDAQW